MREIEDLPGVRDAGAEVAVGIVGLVMVAGQAETDMVVNPEVALSAARKRIELVKARRVFIACDEIGFATAQAIRAPIQERGNTQQLG